MADGGWRMVDGGWWMVDGGWWMVGGGLVTVGGGLETVGGGLVTVGGGWWMGEKLRRVADVMRCRETAGDGRSLLRVSKICI